MADKGKAKRIPETFDYSTVKLPGKKKVQEIMQKSAERMAPYVERLERMHQITEKDLQTMLH
jgi:hypothetical protein